MSYIQIHWTCNQLEEARKISRGLVEKKLVACASIIPSIESVFLWNGKIETAQETKVIFKTKDHLFEEVKKFIIQNATYEVSEILKIAIMGGNEAYLKWVDECLNS